MVQSNIYSLNRPTAFILTLLAGSMLLLASCSDPLTDTSETMDREELLEILENKLGPDITLDDWGMTLDEFESAYLMGQNRIKTSSNSPAMQTAGNGPLNWEADYGTGLEIGDDDCRQVAIGFPFTFYGNTYSEIWVNSNGNLTFNDCNTKFWPTNIPDGDNVIIAPIYGDFVPEAANADVYINVTGTEPNRTFVVTWLDINAWNWPGTNTFQVQLSEADQTILFGYNGLTTNGVNNINDRDMNVGISSGTDLFINSATREEIPDLDMTNICYRPENGEYTELMGICDALTVTADAGQNQTVECSGELTEVMLDGSGSTGSAGNSLSYEWSVDGETVATGVNPVVNLPMGSHIIELTVSDGNGGTSSDEVTIDIVDTTPPELQYTIDATSIWPPNQKMVLAVSDIISVDLCDDAPSLSVIVTYSDTKINGRGKGPRGARADESNNWEVVQNNDGTVDVYIRAVRYSKSGNIYTITLISEDTSGNSVEESIEVKVPHNAS
jgi:hypothetical protein